MLSMTAVLRYMRSCVMPPSASGPEADTCISTSLDAHLLRLPGARR